MTEQPTRTVELFVRSQAGSDVQSIQRRAIDRLNDLSGRGDIDRVDVWVWGKEVCPDMPHDGRSYHLSTIGRVRHFEEWAIERDAEVDLGFRRRTVRSMMADEETTVITLPVLCLAVYEDGDLVGVYPCRENGQRCSIDDALDRLEADVATAVEGITVGSQ